MKVYGDLTDDQVAEVIAAARLHPEFEPERQVQYVCVRPKGEIEVGTPALRNTSPGSYDLAFFVRWNGTSYIVDDTYGEFA
jgi:hypothetical protein